MIVESDVEDIRFGILAPARIHLDRDRSNKFQVFVEYEDAAAGIEGNIVLPLLLIPEYGFEYVVGSVIDRILGECDRAKMIRILSGGI